MCEHHSRSAFEGYGNEKFGDYLKALNGLMALEEGEYIMLCSIRKVQIQVGYEWLGETA